jgi:hypothetical protein
MGRPDESRKIFETFSETGGTSSTPPDGYTNGTSEKMVGEFIQNSGSFCGGD